MDVAEMVDQLIEKRLHDFVRDNLQAGSLAGKTVEEMVGKIVARKIKEKIEEQHDALVAKATAYLDRCDVEIEFGGYGSLQVRVIDPDKK